MKRTVCSWLLFLVASLFSVTSSHAATTCYSTVSGPYCISSVNMDQFYVEAIQSQEQTQWCWAASISMVFSYHGYPVDQYRIVTEAYGGAVNIPAPGYVMASQLNRDWIDNSGNPFSSIVTGLYDYYYGIYGLDNNMLIDYLDRGSPIIIGANAHALVMTEVHYYPTIIGPAVVAAFAYDPWPGVGYRALSPSEFTIPANGGALIFASTVDVAGMPFVSPLPPPAITNSGTGEGGTGSFSYVEVLLMLLLVAFVNYRKTQRNRTLIT